jgi:hypothetical protein
MFTDIDKTMNDQELEQELRRALARIEPDKDFSALVYSRKHVRFWQSRHMLSLAAALILMLLVPIGVYRYQARQKRGEQARDELVTALRITGSKLQKTRQMVVRNLNRRNTI